MTVFKNYDGQVISVSSHNHSPEETVNAENTIALATTEADGFMSKGDRARLTLYNTKLQAIKTKMEKAVYANINKD